MAGRIYLTVAEVKEFHRQLIDEFGGTHGIRDEGRLEAAVLRPQIGYYAGVIEEASALMESLVNNHAFLDGNKRIGFAAADTFLRLNGSFIKVEPSEAYKFISEAMSKGEFRFDKVCKWISSHLTPL